MIDGEVLRLRKLRNVALRARALASNFDLDCAEERSVFSRSALICWTIARVASGRLRGHPYAKYQSGTSWLRKHSDGVFAAVVGWSARRQNRCLSASSQQLLAVAREVDDVRSLTWSQELSDTLGRIQLQMRRLANELDLDALGEIGASSVPRVETPLDAEVSDSSWPYLAIQ
jgi:hypothetical protein